MPHSQYIPGHEPPSMGDRYLMHPYEIPLGIAAMLIGPLILLSTFTEISVSRSLAEAPVWLATLIGVSFAAGAPVFLAGILNPSWLPVGPFMAMTVAMLGAILLSTGGIAFGFGILGNSLGTITAITSLSVGIGHGGRAWGLYRSEKRGQAIVRLKQASKE